MTVEGEAMHHLEDLPFLFPVPEAVPSGNDIGKKMQCKAFILITAASCGESHWLLTYISGKLVNIRGA